MGTDMGFLRVAAILLLGLSTHAKAALVTPCPVTVSDRLADGVLQCERSLSASQDFRGGDPRGYTVNQHAFFNEAQWAYVGGAVGKTSGQSGSVTLKPLNPLADFLLIFKGPNAHSIIGIFIPYSAVQNGLSLTWLSPFLKSGKKPIYQDVSHISLYARTADIPLPPPEEEHIPDVPVRWSFVAILAMLWMFWQKSRRSRQTFFRN
jgi:hypothetical protein